MSSWHALSKRDFIGGSNQEHPSEINPELALESKAALESAEELELEPVNDGGKMHRFSGAKIHQ